jgi:hypothetical protein
LVCYACGLTVVQNGEVDEQIRIRPRKIIVSQDFVMGKNELEFFHIPSDQNKIGTTLRKRGNKHLPDKTRSTRNHYPHEFPIVPYLGRMGLDDRAIAKAQVIF